jgi:hypothetical protein
MITTHDDIVLQAKRLSMTPVALFPVVALPAYYITYGVLVRFMPSRELG